MKRDFDCFAAQNRLSVRIRGKRFCRLSQKVFGLVIAIIAGCDLQRNRLDIRSLFSRISSIDYSSPGLDASQYAKQPQIT
jgi:hypothetical protein